MASLLFRSKHERRLRSIESKVQFDVTPVTGPIKSGIRDVQSEGVALWGPGEALGPELTHSFNRLTHLSVESRHSVSNRCHITDGTLRYELAAKVLADLHQGHENKRWWLVYSDIQVAAAAGAVGIGVVAQCRNVPFKQLVSLPEEGVSVFPDLTDRRFHPALFVLAAVLTGGAPDGGPATVLHHEMGGAENRPVCTVLVTCGSIQATDESQCSQAQKSYVEQIHLGSVMKTKLWIK